EIGRRAAEVCLDALAMSAQDPLDTVAHRGLGFEARNAIGFRVIADVLNLKLTRQSGPHEVEIVVAGQLDRAAPPEHDLGALHRILDLLRARRVEASKGVLIHRDSSSAQSSRAIPRSANALSSLRVTSGTVIRLIASGSRTRWPQRSSLTGRWNSRST